MADLIPIKSHAAFERQTKRSAAGVLRDVRATHPREVFVVYLDAAGEVGVQGFPPDPGNALWLMEMAKAKLLGLRNG